MTYRLRAVDACLYLDFSLTSLYDNAICEFSNYRLIREKIC